ncbi:MAG: Calx-beta domain-containing protein [Cyanobacteriota bacterium]
MLTPFNADDHMYYSHRDVAMTITAQLLSPAEIIEGTSSSFIVQISRPWLYLGFMNPGGYPESWYTPSFSWQISHDTTTDLDFIGELSGSTQGSIHSRMSSVDSFPTEPETFYLSLTVRDDLAHEFTESFSLSLEWEEKYYTGIIDPLTGMPGRVLVNQWHPAGSRSFSIVDNDPGCFLALSAKDADKSEGNNSSSATLYEFQVARSGDLSQPTTVNWRINLPSTSNASPADFSPAGLPQGTITFAPNQPLVTFFIPISADLQFEGDEIFHVQLENPSLDALITTSTASGIIRNDDSLLAIEAQRINAEGETAGYTDFTFKVTRTGDISLPATASWSVTSQSCDGADFRGGTIPTGDLTFPAGVASADIHIGVAADLFAEGDEVFNITLLTATGASLDPLAATGTGVILADEVPLSIDRLFEGQANYTLTITRSIQAESGPSGSLRYYLPAIQWSVNHGLTDAADFSGPITGSFPEEDFGFSPPYPWPSFEANIIVPIGNDFQTEASEDFSINTELTTYSWEFIPPSDSFGFGHWERRTNLSTSSRGPIWILDEDIPSLALSAATSSAIEGNGAPSELLFNITRSGALNGFSNVMWSVEGTGTNPAGADDFVGGSYPSGQLDFLPNEASKTVKIPVSGDTSIEFNETYCINLVGPTGAMLSPLASSASGTIINDDPPVITGVTTRGNQLELQFSGAVATTGLTKSRFSASVNNVARLVSSWSPVVGDNSRLMLTLAGAQPISSQSIRVCYTDLTSANDAAGVIQDSNGNDLATIASPGIAADTFVSSANVTTLDDTYKSLDLIGSAVSAVGNKLDNRITSNQPSSVNNIINGGEGIDQIDAKGGSDVYIVTSGSHHSAAEINDSGSALGEIDELRFSSTTEDDCLTVFADDRGLERIIIGTGTLALANTAGTASVDVDASQAPNQLDIRGNCGANVLVGTWFADTLNGNRGNDILLGGAGADVFVFDSILSNLGNRDSLPDFAPSLDRIHLQNSIFAALPQEGPLDAQAFSIGQGATSLAHRIIYNNTTGMLTYDSNGSMAGGATRFAMLPIGLQSVLSASAFQVV